MRNNEKKHEQVDKIRNKQKRTDENVDRKNGQTDQTRMSTE